jgi:CRP-like cAMP-binding protein
MELTDKDLQWAKNNLKRVELFVTCSEAEIDELVNGMEKVSYNQGSTVLFQGEISSKLCLVQNGKVSVNIRKGKEKNKVAELGSGTFFGEISLLRPQAATATIKAEETTDILFLPGEAVQAMVKKNSELSEAINKKIDERLEKSRQAMEQKDEDEG